MTTELLMVRAIERGLSLLDFNELTPGMIVDYIITYNNLNNIDEDKETEAEREAVQSDFDNF